MDWFKSLPSHIQRHILGRVPFDEVAGRSIGLSVILDKFLFEERGRWIGELHPSAWVDKVNEILEVIETITDLREALINPGKGPIPITIQKFALHIPAMQYKWGLYIDTWLSRLSSNSIKELSVDNCNSITYKLSNIISEWPELTRLVLHNCAFHKTLGSFQNLRFLHLKKIAFGSFKVGAVRFCAPLLVRSELVDCTGFQHLSIEAPLLEKFVVASGDGLSRDDANQIRLKLGGRTIDDEGGRSCRSCRGRCRWGEPGYRVNYVFYPGNELHRFGLI